MQLRVVVIVEGHGEDAAIRPLFERIWYEHLQSTDQLEVITWRSKQGQLLNQEGLRRVVEAAAIKLHAPGPGSLRRLLLIMIDTEGDPGNCPKARAPELVKWARDVRSDLQTEIECVMPNTMFETWFAAAAESLRGQNGLPEDLTKPTDPEGEKLGKRWLKKHLPRKYKEAVDQPKFASVMRLAECEASSRSFRKLLKVLRERAQSNNPVVDEPPAAGEIDPEP